MNRNDLLDLNTFLAVAEERSFTRAAARLSTSQSAISHAVRRLEARLGVRLLTRTTRSVSLTDPGEHLLQSLRPAFAEIDASVTAVGAFRERPTGIIRITSPRHAALRILWPAIRSFNDRCPEVCFEISIDTGTRNIIAERFDAGVRLGDLVSGNMIAIRIGPEMRMAAVASPAYLAARGRPASPDELAGHACINFRLPSSGAHYVWEFAKGGLPENTRVSGNFTFNDPDLMKIAALDGRGIACLMEDHVAAEIRAGELVRILDDWCPPFEGYHLYYASRKNNSLAFRLFVDHVRMRA